MLPSMSAGAWRASSKMKNGNPPDSRAILAAWSAVPAYKQPRRESCGFRFVERQNLHFTDGGCGDCAMARQGPDASGCLAMLGAIRSQK